MVGRPFEKGQSGNPGGRPKGIAAKAREFGERALEVLSAALEDDDGRIRIAAAKELLDRGYGKSVQMTADVSKVLDEFDDDTLNSAIDALRAAIGDAEEHGSGTGAETTH